MADQVRHDVIPLMGLDSFASDIEICKHISASLSSYVIPANEPESNIVLHPLSHGERLFQERRILLDIASAFGSRSAEGALELHAVKTGDPPANAALRDVHGLRVGVGGRREQVNLAELVIAGIEGIRAVEHRLELAAHLVIVNRRREHDDISRFHLLGDGGSVVLDDALALLLTSEAAHAKTDLLAAQRLEFHLVARLGGTLRELLRQGFGVAPLAQAAGQDQYFFHRFLSVEVFTCSNIPLFSDIANTLFS